VRTLARIHGIPATIARLGVTYGGAHDDGGLPGRMLEALLEGRVIAMPTQPCLHGLLHEDDIVDHIEPLLAAASVPATIVNWGGEVTVDMVEWLNHLGALIGRPPLLSFVEGTPRSSHILDVSKARELGLRWKAPWKEGFRRMVEARHPEIPIRAVN